MNSNAKKKPAPATGRASNATSKNTTTHVARVDLFAAHVLTGLYAAQGREAFDVHPDTAGYYAAEIACAVVRAIDETIDQRAAIAAGGGR